MTKVIGMRHAARWIIEMNWNRKDHDIWYPIDDGAFHVPAEKRGDTVYDSAWSGRPMRPRKLTTVIRTLPLLSDADGVTYRLRNIRTRAVIPAWEFEL